MENKWDNNKFILFCLYFSVYLSYQCFRWKRINPVSFWYSDIPVFQLGILFVILFIVIMLFYSFKRKAQNLDSKGKNSNNVN